MIARFARLALAAALSGCFWLDAPATPSSSPEVKRNAPVSAHRARARARRAKVAAPLAPAGAGMVVAWDPETQTYGPPSAAQRLALTPAEQTGLNHSFDGLAQEHHADGSVSVDLQGRFREFALVRLGSDGRLVFGCVEDSAALRRALLRPATRPSVLEER